MRWQAAGCPVCDSTNRNFICTNCINSQLIQRGVDPNQQQGLQLEQCLAQAEQLREQRAGLLQRLEQQLAHRDAAQSQHIAAWRKALELKVARVTSQHAKLSLSQAQQQLSSLQAASKRRRQVLEQLFQRTAATRNTVFGTELPNVLRIQALTLSHVKAMLEREQRLKLRQLTEIFPLRINAVRSSGGPIHITICNLRLPESASTPAGGWTDPEATSAALGYLLLLVDQVGLIMAGPMLHESMFQASTSSIWQPPGFWARQPRSPGSVLPLNVLATGQATAAAAGQAVYATATSRYLQPANFWGLARADSGAAASTTAAVAAGAAATAASAAAAAFSRATGFDTAGMYSSSPGSGTAFTAGSSAGVAIGSSRGGSSSNPPEPGDSRGSRNSDFRSAWDLLQRSLACFLKDKAAANGMQLPAAWNPVAWLVVYCAVIKRDTRQDGKLVALSARATAAAAAHDADTGSKSLVLNQLGEPAGLASGSTLGSVVMGVSGAQAINRAGDLPGRSWEDPEDEEDEEGWVVQTPFLPPPPSQPDEVEHWVRAMFADPNALAGAGQQGAGSPGHYGLALALPGRRIGMGSNTAGLLRGGLSGNVQLGSSPSAGSGVMMSMERIRSLFSM